MNAEVIKEVVYFNSLPNTPEKKRICDAFLNDEICSLDFYGEVRKYIKGEKQNDS